MKYVCVTEEPNISPRAEALIGALEGEWRKSDSTVFDAECPLCSRYRLPLRVVDGPTEIIGKCQHCKASLPEIEAAVGLVYHRQDADGTKYHPPAMCEDRKGFRLQRSGTSSEKWVEAACERCDGCQRFTDAMDVQLISETFSDGAWLLVIEDAVSERRRAKRAITKAGGVGYLPVPMTERRRALFTGHEVSGAVWIPKDAITQKATELVAANPHDGRSMKPSGYKSWRRKRNGSGDSEWKLVGYFQTQQVPVGVLAQSVGNDRVEPTAHRAVFTEAELIKLKAKIRTSTYSKPRDMPQRWDHAVNHPLDAMRVQFVQPADVLDLQDLLTEHRSDVEASLRRMQENIAAVFEELSHELVTA